MEKVPFIRFLHNAALLEDGRVLVSGGFSGVANNNVIIPIPREDFQIFDPGAESWSLITPEESRAIMTTTIGLSDDRHMSVGIGVNEEGESVGVSGVFDAGTQSWTPLPSPALIRGFPNMALLADGRVLVTGGIDFSDPSGFVFEHLKDAEIFDPDTEMWQQATPMNNAAEHQAVVPLQDGRAMVVHSGVATAEIYDSASDSWTLTAEMDSTPLTPKAVVLLDGRVLVTGVVSNKFADYGKTKRHDPDTDTWVPIDPKTGEDIEAPKNVSEIYDPASDTWIATEAMTEIRMSHTLTLLSDGRALVTSGTNFGLGIDAMSEESKISDQFLLATEIFNPATNEWTPGPQMSEPRYDHTATLLSDGRIFIFGGVTVREDIQEIYPTHTSEIINIPVSP